MMIDRPALPLFEQPTMERIIERIDERLAELGLTDRQASLRATGLPDAIREIRRGKRPGSKRMTQLAKALETTPDYIGGYVDHQKSRIWMETTESVLPIAGVSALPRNIPVFAAAREDSVSWLEADQTEIEILKYDLSSPIDMARRPPRLQLREDVYALIVFGTSMYPRYRAGELIYVDPRGYPLEGEDCLINLRDAKFAEPNGFSLLTTNRERVWGAPNSPRLERFNPAATFKLSWSKIASAHRIIPLGELLSL